MKVEPGKVELYREVVPLTEATATAWHIITDRRVSLADPGQLEEVRGLVAIALASVAPILQHREDGNCVALSSAEINQRLFVLGSRPDLSGLCMRRVDLLRAVEALKEARITFDRRHVPDALRILS